MTGIFQITANQVISGVCKAIHLELKDDVHIYKEEQNQPLKLPAVTVYCSYYEKTQERFDRFVNDFDIIINYFPDDNTIIKNNSRMTMFDTVEKIADCINYISLPAFKKQDGQLIPTELPNRRKKCEIKEHEGFMQIVASYTVRTKKVPDPSSISKMGDKLQININGNC